MRSVSSRRVAELEVVDFKGYRGRHAFRLDADLVLVVGHNGLGKTSLVEALEVGLTGRYQQRIGDPKDFRFYDLVHREARGEGRAGAESSVCIRWADGHSSVATVSAKGNKGELTGGWAESADRWSPEPARKLLRSGVFLYPDSFGQVLAADDSARKEILDRLLPGSPVLERAQQVWGPALGQRARGALGRLSHGRPDPEAAGRKEVAEARVLAEGLRRATGTEPSVFTRDKLYSQEKRIVDGLTPATRALFPDIQDDSLNPLLTRLAGRADAEARRIREEARATAPATPTASPADGVLAAIRALPTPPREPTDVLEARMEALPSPEGIQATTKAVEEAREAIRARRARLWIEEDRADLPVGPHRLPAGEIPLATALLRVAEDPEPPGWWTGLGLPPLDAADVRRIRDGLGGEWEDLDVRQRTLDEQARELREADRRRSDLRRQVDALKALEEAWAVLDSSRSPPRDAVGALDVVEIGRQARGATLDVRPAVAGEGDGAAALESIADAARRWQEARAEREEEERRLAAMPDYDAAHTSLEEIAGFADQLSSGVRGFGLTLRARLATERFQDPLTRTMRSVLQGFDHRKDMLGGARVKFDGGGRLYAEVAGAEGSTSGITTFSRSQLTSLMFSLQIATHLSHPEMPVDLVCLDDLSDVFDLNNLAQDAVVLRMLAYGPASRQVILTTHHDEITDRLVPLLLPPHGKSMRILEIRDGGSGTPAVEHYVVGEEGARSDGAPGDVDWRSPLRDVLRPA